MSNTKRAHTFHIPVMGTGFTIDSPVKVAKYGISSVIALLDDVLIEQMRKFHSIKEGFPYSPIDTKEEDSRARRITAYLDLINQIVRRQVDDMRKSSFEPGNDLTRYFEMLPDGDERTSYLEMLSETDPAKKSQMQDSLKEAIIPGNIDVNIMTKCDRDKYRGKEKLPPQFADAMSALRGFAKSKLRSSVVFSAGLNPRLYAYTAEFDDFIPDKMGNFIKKIILKVSDFRSAEIQGKFLAKKGLWISEYRIESGLNCGGHAFAGKGNLILNTLQEFQSKREEMLENLFNFFNKAVKKAKGFELTSLPETLVTVQGGIGTHEEDKRLREVFGADGTGWGTPFLLVPEVVNIDDDHLKKLRRARMKHIFLSESSPLGVPFWNLKKSASEMARKYRIKLGKPGSKCVKGYPAFNSEFTDVPVCTASRFYQRMKIEELKKSANLKKRVLKAKIKETLQKSCLCNDLAGSALMNNLKYRNVTPAITTGPNIVNFKKIVTLKQMVDHIYGRQSLHVKKNRKDLFITELALNIEKLKTDIKKYQKGLLPDARKQIEEYRENLIEGIGVYRATAEKYIDTRKKQFMLDLRHLASRLEHLNIPSTT